MIHLSACVLYIWERARAGVVIDAECSEMQFHGFCDTQRYDAGRERETMARMTFSLLYTFARCVCQFMMYYKVYNGMSGQEGRDMEF